MTKVPSAEDNHVQRSNTEDVREAILTNEAHRGVETETHMSLWQGLRTYPRAVGWSILFSTALVMEGYDTTLIGNLFAMGSFQKQYGVKQPNGTYQLTAAWQAGLSNGALVGEILGLFVNGIICDRFGYRKTIMGALTLCIGFIFIVFFSKNLPTLLVGEILLGIPWGVFQTVTTTYAAEVCPVVLRPYLTTYVNLCWVMGQFIASGVLKGVQTMQSEWAYRIPFAVQWVWPVPIIIGVALAPESPWWLVRRGRLEDAKKALLRLTSPDADPSFNADETIAMIERTNKLEREITSGTSYFDCFKGSNLRRTEIVCVTWAIQTLCGSTFMGYSTYFYEQAGLAPSNAFTMSLVQYVLGAVGTVSSWLLVSWFGRRTLYLSGQAIQTCLLVIVGVLGCVANNNPTVHWAIGSMLLIYTFSYDATIGPVCYSLVAELSSSRLRAKTVVLARNLYNMVGIVTNVLTPHMLNPSAWNWGAKAGFFWACTCFVCFIWTYFRLPEPKGRTYAELDLLFERKVSARKFKATVVDPFETSGSVEISEKKEADGYMGSVEVVENAKVV